MNSLAAVSLTDFVKPVYLIVFKKEMHERMTSIVAKSLGKISTKLVLIFHFVINVLKNVL